MPKINFLLSFLSSSLQTKLEGYRALDALGRELSSEQRAAVSKYDAVLTTLDFARDLVKQMQQFAKDAEKEQKKQARKVNMFNIR